jgi:hypothetical protein
VKPELTKYIPVCQIIIPERHPFITQHTNKHPPHLNDVTHNRENLTTSTTTSTTTTDWHTTTVCASSSQAAPLIRASYIHNSTDESRNSSARFGSCVQWTRILWSDTTKITNWPHTMSHRKVRVHDNANCRASRREYLARMSKNG